MTCFTIVFILILFFILPFGGLSQQSKYLGSYNSVYVEVPVSKRWSLFNENELRSTRVFNRYYYDEIKAGVNYKYNDRITFTTALGMYNTFNGGPEFDSMEKKTDYRLWQQLNYKHGFYSAVVDHRVRVEELINKNFQPTFRYRLQPKFPINKQSLDAGVLFATAFDEVFVRFHSPLLRRNRIFGGLGYYFTKKISVQSGILRQTDYKTGAENFTKNFFYISGSFKL